MCPTTNEGRLGINSIIWKPALMLWVKTCSGCCSLNGSLLKVLKIPNMQKQPTLLWPLLKEWNPFSCIHANQNSGDDQKWLTRFAWVLRARWNFTHMAETFDEQFGNVTKKTNLITQASYLPHLLNSHFSECISTFIQVVFSSSALYLHSYRCVTDSNLICKYVHYK